MSYTTSMIAARVSNETLKSAVRDAWKYEPVAGGTTCGTFDELCDWLGENDSDSAEAKGLYRDGPWAVLLDLSLTMSSDSAKLAALSKTLGRVIVNSTQGTSGFAELVVFDDGVRTRRITSLEGELKQKGTPLPEEEGLDLGDFYMGAHEELAHRLGLASFWGEAQGPFEAFQVRDPSLPVRTSPPPAASRNASVKSKPWWRFW